MEESVCKNFVAILNSELMVALGCTEPIAIAYAGAKVRQVLGKMPEHVEVACSGNIIKNVKGVTVPNSGGQKGIAVAAALGIVGGDADRELAVLETITPEHQETVRQLLKTDFCDCSLVEGVANLYILITAQAGEESAQVEISTYHTNITRITKNGKVVLEKKEQAPADTGDVVPDKSQLNLKDILEFGRTVDLKLIAPVLERQIECNSAISAEGLKNPWGAQVGRTLLACGGETPDLRTRAKAAAAAGSDARMNGCPLPVVINSGSGNQGITITMPLLTYAKAYGKSHEETLRALAVANLISVHQKKYIGSLSAYCGATSAACASAAAICWMLGGSEKQIADTITNTICTVGGMVCDGAKSSCAAKIASAVDTAVTALEMSRAGNVFQPGEGLVLEDVEGTIRSVGRMGREGMKSTDIEILNIMLGK
jgi:L-cysteine desulfidase